MKVVRDTSPQLWQSTAMTQLRVVAFLLNTLRPLTIATPGVALLPTALGRLLRSHQCLLGSALHVPHDLTESLLFTLSAVIMRIVGGYPKGLVAFHLN